MDNTQSSRYKLRPKHEKNGVLKALWKTVEQATKSYVPYDWVPTQFLGGVQGGQKTNPSPLWAKLDFDIFRL